MTIDQIQAIGTHIVTPLAFVATIYIVGKWF